MRRLMAFNKSVIVRQKVKRTIAHLLTSANSRTNSTDIITQMRRTRSSDAC